MSDDRVDATPEPTPAEAEAIRRALEALGLLDTRERPAHGPGDALVTGSMPNLVSGP